MLVKEVWQFSSGPGGAWNEVYYWEGAGIDEATKLKEIFLLGRLNMLHPHNSLDKIRYSDVAHPRVTAMVTMNRSGTAKVEAGEGPAPVGDACVLNLVSTVVPSSRKLWLGGISEEEPQRTTAAGVDHVRAEFREKIKEWLQLLTLNGYVVNTRQRASVGTLEKGFITRVNGELNPGHSVLHLDANIGAEKGDFIIVNAASKKDLPGLFGTFQVEARAGNTYTVAYATPRNQDITGVKQGYAFKLVRRPGAVISASRSGFAYWGVRRRKNVNTGSRGARPAQRLRK